VIGLSRLGAVVMDSLRAGWERARDSSEGLWRNWHKLEGIGEGCDSDRSCKSSVALIK